MKKKAYLFCFAFILLVLSACSETQPVVTDASLPDAVWQGYSGPEEAYSFYHADGRDREWEEDILFLADAFLTGHPALSDGESLLISYNGSYDAEITYTDELYNPQLRQAFIQQINQIIPQISQLSDTRIPFELNRIVAMLSDCHSNVGQPLGDILPIHLEAIHREEGYGYYVKTAPADLRELLYARLVSINNVPVEEIVQRLAGYIPHECEIFVVQKMTLGRYLVRKLALEIAGVLDTEDTQAQLTFMTQKGVQTCTLDFMPQEAYDSMECLDGSLSRYDLPMYRYADEKVFWYEQLDDNTLYFRITSMWEDPNQNWNSTFQEVGRILRTAPAPMKLIIDLRDNHGGKSAIMENFVPILNQCPTNGIYVLINESTASAAVITAQLLSDSVPGLKLAGSPAAQPANMFALVSQVQETLPNSGYSFYVSPKYTRTAPNSQDPTLLPDILVYPTLEDYKNGVDTVLEYVLDLS